ncbi:MAG TPA: hypothetical protein GXX38_09985 [Clostridia bacterium]|jgi:predicted amidohydrolase|nr:hypothetical protein [Clostridia bacterium]
MRNKEVCVAAVQMRSITENKEANLKKSVEFIKKAAAQGAQIICLPELFITGYELNREGFLRNAERLDGPTISTLSNLAKELGVYIIAPLPEQGDLTGVIYNSAVLLDRWGEIVGVFRKTQLWAKEKLYFRPGDRLPVFDTEYGKIGILICYDAEFPEIGRRLALQGAEIFFIPSAWTIGYKHTWDTALAARCLENTVFGVGVNMVGEGQCGHSRIIDPQGRNLQEAGKDEETILIQKLDLGSLIKHRMDLPYLKDLRDII